MRRLGNVESANEGVQELFALAALSRLVHPTSIGSRYCANVHFFGANDSPVQALQYRGISPDAILAKQDRDWLSATDATVLRNLLPWLSRHMHKRLHRAYWNHEYAIRTVYLDQRWTLVISAFEALISAGKHNPKGQFCEGTIQLAMEFQQPLTKDELKTAYDMRSKLVHAEASLGDLDAVLPKTEHHDLYARLEGLLRVTLRRALLDEEFGDRFRE